MRCRSGDACVGARRNEKIPENARPRPPSSWSGGSGGGGRRGGFFSTRRPRRAPRYTKLPSVTRSFTRASSNALVPPSLRRFVRHPALDHARHPLVFARCPHRASDTSCVRTQLLLTSVSRPTVGRHTRLLPKPQRARRACDRRFSPPLPTSAAAAFAVRRPLLLLLSPAARDPLPAAGSRNARVPQKQQQQHQQCSDSRASSGRRPRSRRRRRARRSKRQQPLRKPWAWPRPSSSIAWSCSTGWWPLASKSARRGREFFVFMVWRSIVSPRRPPARSPRPPFISKTPPPPPPTQVQGRLHVRR